MQTVETLNEGLKRAYTLTITAQDIEGKVDAELKRIAPQMKMPGFRPGKVPANLVRKMHGPALLREEAAVRDFIDGPLQPGGLEGIPIRLGVPYVRLGVNRLLLQPGQISEGGLLHEPRPLVDLHL